MIRQLIEMQQYLTFNHSLHSGMPIKQVGGADGVPKKKTYLQLTKHKQETQLNQNKGQCPIENILKHYVSIHIERH